jgi:hypothetical protein
LIPPEVHAGALSDAASKPALIKDATDWRETAKKPRVDSVMPFDERGQIIIGQAFHKRLEFLEKDTVIRETL